MTSIQFLHLPWVTQNIIIKNFTPIEILKLSFISKKSHALARHTKLEVEEFDWSFKKADSCLTTGTRLDGKTCNTFAIKQCSAFDQKQLEKAFQVKIDGLDLTLGFGENNRGEVLYVLYVSERVGEGQDPSEMITARLLGLMRVRAFNCYFYETQIPQYIFKFTMFFKNFVSRGSDALTHEEARLIVEETTIVNHLNLFTIQPGFLTTKPFKQKRVWLGKAPWFTGNNLMDVECEFLNGRCESLQRADLEAFLNKWKSGGLPKLQEVQIVMRSDIDLRREFGEIGENGQFVTDNQGRVGKFIIHANIFVFFVKK